MALGVLTEIPSTEIFIPGTIMKQVLRTKDILSQIKSRQQIQNFPQTI